MKTILVPTDFSDASLNAALYALGYAKQIDVKKIVFYHSYSAPIHLSPEPESTEKIDFNILKDAANNGLIWKPVKIIR